MSSDVDLERVTYVFEKVADVDQYRQGFSRFPVLVGAVARVDGYARPVPFGSLDLESRLSGELEEESQAAEVAVRSCAQV